MEVKVFNAYSKYYDLLYKDKDYRSEAEYVMDFIRRHKPDAGSILDLGCGTGKHDICFAENKYEVTGVELSKSMFEKAKNNLTESGLVLNLKFLNDDIRRLRLGRKFDIITSLFHVMSYQTSNEDLSSMIKTVSSHLKSDGKFLCDFWYGPAVLTDRPESRVKRLEDPDWIIERFAEPVLKPNENTVEVKYKILINSTKEKLTREITEVHRMRYLFLPELEYFLDEQNLRIEYAEEWMTGKCLSDSSWYGFAVITQK